MRGRPPLYVTEPKIVDDIEKAIGDDGLPENLAADSVGIARSAYFEWKAIGRAALEKKQSGAKLNEKERRAADFAQRITRARVKARRRMVMLVQVAAATDWRAGAWYLEAMEPETYSRNRLAAVAVNKEGDPTGAPVPAGEWVFRLQFADGTPFPTQVGEEARDGDPVEVVRDAKSADPERPEDEP